MEQSNTLLLKAIYKYGELSGSGDQIWASEICSFKNSATKTRFQSFLEWLMHLNGDVLSDKKGDANFCLTYNLGNYDFNSLLTGLLSADKDGESTEYVLELLSSLKQTVNDIIDGAIEQVEAQRSNATEMNIKELANNLGMTPEEIKAKLGLV